MIRDASRTEDVILELWQDCQAESLGERELTSIQKSLTQKLGVTESPARIARVLAEHQIRLRHPEILAADSRWREDQIDQVPDVRQFDFRTIESAISSMRQLETVRKRFVSERNETALEIVVEQVRELKLEFAREQTDLTDELVQWFVIWLQNPEIFGDWSELRQNSPEFLERFSSKS
jgi:hypothetical protein